MSGSHLHSQLHKPSRLDRAWESLTRAVDRLEAAAQSRAEAGPDAETVARLEAAEAEAAALRRTTQETSARLDDAIRRLHEVLGE